MPASFAGASNFTIAGGNFGDVEGNVITYNFGDGLQNLPPNTLATLAPPNTAGNRTPRRERKRLEQQQRLGTPLPSAQIHSVPSSVAPGSPSSMATPISRPSHSLRPSPAVSPVSRASAFTPSPISESSLDSEFERYHTASPHSSRDSTPPTDLEEHQHNGLSGVPPPVYDLNVDLLTPLTNSLGLQRFTPATVAQTLPTLHENSTPARSLPSTLSPTPESPAGFGLEPRRAPSGPPPPPPASTRPVFHAVRHESVPAEMQRVRRDPLGPPPPVPPRPQTLSPAWTSTTAPVDTPFPVSRPMSATPVTPTQVPRLASPQSQASALTGPTLGQPDLEDPATRFARLQGQRSSTKGYASGLSPRSQGTPTRNSPPTLRTASSPPPPPPSTRPPPLPLSSNVPRASPISSPNRAIAPVPEYPAAQETHWTPDSITGWAGEINGRRLDGSDTVSSGDSRSVQPPTSPPHQRMQPYEEQQYQHQHFSQPHYHNARQASHDALWGSAQPQMHQPPFGYHQPSNPPFPAFHFSNAPPVAVPPFGAPFFNEPPSFSGPGFGSVFGYPH